MMRHVRSLRFDALEARKLLTTAQIAAVATPLVLDGTLNVNMNDASTTTNPDNSTTTSAPVSGRLGTLGKVKGTWDNSQDQFGDYQGPDTIQLQVVSQKGTTTPKGTFTIEFNDQDSGKAQMIGHGIGFFQHAERLQGGTGSFAKDSENGSIEVFVNPSKKTVESLELITTNTPLPSKT